MASSQWEHLPYRPCAGIMLLNTQKHVFVGQRIDTRTEAWQMPQGGVDEGEDVTAAAYRELKEETGIDKTTLITESANWIPYDLPEHLIPELWGGKYRGQKQKWFLMQFEGEDSDVNIQTETPEFRDWRWISPQELPELIVPFKRSLYQQVLEEFRVYL